MFLASRSILVTAPIPLSAPSKVMAGACPTPTRKQPVPAWNVAVTSSPMIEPTTWASPYDSAHATSAALSASAASVLFSQYAPITVMPGKPPSGPLRAFTVSLSIASSAEAIFAGHTSSRSRRSSAWSLLWARSRLARRGSSFCNSRRSFTSGSPAQSALTSA